MYGTNALHLSLNKYIRFFVYHIRERRNELLLLLLPIVVIEVKYSCVRAIVIVTSTFEERVVRVHKVSVIFSVISLLYHYFSFKSLCKPVFRASLCLHEKLYVCSSSFILSIFRRNFNRLHITLRGRGETSCCCSSCRLS